MPVRMTPPLISIYLVTAAICIVTRFAAPKKKLPRWSIIGKRAWALEQTWEASLRQSFHFLQMNLLIKVLISINQSMNLRLIKHYIEYLLSLPKYEWDGIRQTVCMILGLRKRFSKANFSLRCLSLCSGDIAPGNNNENILFDWASQVPPPREPKGVVLLFLSNCSSGRHFGNVRVSFEGNNLLQNPTQIVIQILIGLGK